MAVALRGVDEGDAQLPCSLNGANRFRVAAGRVEVRLDLAADHGLTIFTYTAEPGSPSEDALRLLGSWAVTVDPADPADPAPQRATRSKHVP